ncbi:hypothetical protein J6S88_07095 [bacterium]|nr:hypothetical protein [bacterium]
MRISVKNQPLRSYAHSYKNNQRHQNITYGAGVKTGLCRTGFNKKYTTWLVALTMMLGSLFSCAVNNRSVKENREDFAVECYGVRDDLKTELVERYMGFRSELKEDNDFLRDVKLVITNKNSDLEDDLSFKTFLKNSNTYRDVKGLSYYSDKKIQKVIAIQINPHTKADNMYLLAQTGGNSIAPLLNYSLMHEIGHQFDEYFGHDHSAEFALDFDSIMYIREENPQDNPYEYRLGTETEENIIAEYSKNNGLSDKKEFKDAILKDFKNIAGMRKTAPGFLPSNIGYYTAGIDFSKSITAQDVDLADNARSEVYASLFAYANGENDGEKTFFIQAFPNSYEVVKSDIKCFLGDDFIRIN